MKAIFKFYNGFVLPIAVKFFFIRAGYSISYVLKKRAGQSTVEYLLMLAVVAGMTMILGVLFHKKLLGGFFTIVGMVIGGGTPT
ncbi:MAG: hypothetical protein KAI33_08750 [Elusimicrobiales bacterium]|nr:hypothetical protein [Elusimicrobiales bacterium]